MTPREAAHRQKISSETRREIGRLGSPERAHMALSLNQGDRLRKSGHCTPHSGHDRRHRARRRWSSGKGRLVYEAVW